MRTLSALDWVLGGPRVASWILLSPSELRGGLQLRGFRDSVGVGFWVQMYICSVYIYITVFIPVVTSGPMHILPRHNPQDSMLLEGRIV